MSIGDKCKGSRGIQCPAQCKREPSMYFAVISDSQASSEEIRRRLAMSGSATKTRIRSLCVCNNGEALTSGISEKELKPSSPAYVGL
jgi:hypothetical protein